MNRYSTFLLMQLRIWRHNSVIVVMWWWPRFYFVPIYDVIGAALLLFVIAKRRLMLLLLFLLWVVTRKGERAQEKRPLTFLSHKKRSRSYLSVSANVCLFLSFPFLCQVLSFLFCLFLLRLNPPTLHHVPKAKKCDSFTVQLDLLLDSTTRGECSRETRKSKAKKSLKSVFSGETRRCDSRQDGVVYNSVHAEHRAVYIQFIAHPLNKEGGGGGGDNQLQCCVLHSYRTVRYFIEKIVSTLHTLVAFPFIGGKRRMKGKDERKARRVCFFAVSSKKLFVFIITVP